MNDQLARTKELTEKARREAAEKAFAWEAVELAIRTAAAAGLDKVTIGTPSLLKIKHTPAAIGAAAKLQERGFRLTWTEQRPAQGGAAGDVLEIAW